MTRDGYKLSILIPAPRLDNKQVTQAEVNLCSRTWVRDAQRSGLEIRFFRGSQENDDFYRLSYKTREMFKYGLQVSNASHFLKVDTDSYVWIDRLNQLEWWEHEYLGSTAFPPLSPPFDFHYASGAGYILSRRAAEFVTQASPTFTTPTHTVEDNWAEDRFVGRVMHEHGIPLHMDTRISFNQWWDEEKFVIWHGFGTRDGHVNKHCPFLAEGA